MSVGLLPLMHVHSSISVSHRDCLATSLVCPLFLWPTTLDDTESYCESSPTHRTIGHRSSMPCFNNRTCSSSVRNHEQVCVCVPILVAAMHCAAGALLGRRARLAGVGGETVSLTVLAVRVDDHMILGNSCSAVSRCGCWFRTFLQHPTHEVLRTLVAHICRHGWRPVEPKRTAMMHSAS